MKKIENRKEGCALSACLIWVNSTLFEEEAELATVIFAVESIDLYSSSILSNKMPFENASIFLLRMSTCRVFQINYTLLLVWMENVEKSS